MGKLKAWQKILLALVVIIIGLPVLIFIIAGLLPVTSDPVVPQTDVIVGAQGKVGGSSINMDFPVMAFLKDNPISTDKQDLGKLLFFDPILSAKKDMACATCHHPDLGFSDARPTGQGSDGKPLKRNVPSLYEVAYKTDLFWDGRAANLEAQMQTPLTAPNEMANTADQLVKDLQAIPEYKTLFAKAFPGQSDPITAQNIAFSIATFERSLVAHNSPFDRYANGDLSALSPSQRRGFALFRSGATGCYKCHAAPTFTNGEFAVTGIPDADNKLTDTGKGAITGVATENYAFKIPSLRNVALSAPYMHNGRFATLEEVVAFYAKGGPKGFGIDLPNLSRFVNPFELSDQETKDLVNFLYSLTDESTKPTIPDKVPSGLPVVATMDNPARKLVAAINTGGAAVTKRPPQTLTVTPDVTIQSVIDSAQGGDTIQIQYGTYSERVLIDLNDITVRGVPNAAGDYPVLDGQMKYSDGIAASGNNFTIEKLAIKNYRGNGIIVDGAMGVNIRDLYVENTSLYGVYPVHSTNIVVERVKATKIRDAGIYCGQCLNVVIKDNEVYGNVIGIEMENSINSEAFNNHVYDNSTGIFVDLLPQLPSKISTGTKVHDNLIENNNHDNFALQNEIGQLVPQGGGILVLGGDDVEIYKNTIRDNQTAGVAVFSTAVAFKPEQIDVSPNPERLYLHDNTYTHNGYKASKQLTDMGINGADVIWDVSNWDMKFDEKGVSSFPPVLPSSSWPDFARKSYWQILHFVISKLT